MAGGWAATKACCLWLCIWLLALVTDGPSLPAALPCHSHPCLQVLGKKKLRWKRIAEHFGKKVKACRKHYHKLTGKEAPEDED
jgi:hypothetical protein